MSITKYCRDCKAQVLSDESLCPFCGGELAESKPSEEPIEVKYLDRDMSRREYDESAVSIGDKMSRRTWLYGAMLALVFSVGTASTAILNPICAGGLVALFVLTLAVYYLNNSILCIAATVISAAMLIYSFIKYGGDANVSLLYTVVSVYLSFKLVKLDRAWLKYKKGNDVTPPVDDRELVKRWKPDTLKKKLIVTAIFTVAFAAAFTVVFVINYNENQKYKGYTVGFWDENVYYNNFANVKLTAPEGWNRLDEAVLREKTESEFKNSTADYCYWMTDENGNCAYLEQYKQGTEKYAIEDFLDVVKQSDTDAEYGEYQNVEFCGKTYSALVSNKTIEGKDEKSIILVDKYLKYTIIFKFTADSDANAQIIENAFGFDAEGFGE